MTNKKQELLYFYNNKKEEEVMKITQQLCIVIIALLTGCLVATQASIKPGHERRRFFCAKYSRRILHHTTHFLCPSDLHQQSACFSPTSRCNTFPNPCSSPAR